jgi:hypothetical protein
MLVVIIGDAALTLHNAGKFAVTMSLYSICPKHIA